ncbi:MAG: enoyl-CoA hydratase [Burkholderiaceae bacterium]
MTSDDLQFELRDDGVAVLTMNRPDRLNALSASMIEAAIDALQRCATDESVGCVLLTGAGRGFCAGGDVSMMAGPAVAAMTLEQQIDRQRGIHRFAALLHSMPKVTLAAVNGAAAGAGLGLALACDLRIASSTARLTTAFAKVGFSGDFGVTWGLVQLLGEAKAKELLFLSETVDAEEALRLGLVNRVEPAEEFGAAALALATRIASGPRTALRYMKENVGFASSESYEALLDREAFSQRRCAQTDDHREGVAAFMQKRPPKFGER